MANSILWSFSRKINWFCRKIVYLLQKFLFSFFRQKQQGDDRYFYPENRINAKDFQKVPNSLIIWLLLISEHTHQVMSTFRLGLPD